MKRIHNVLCDQGDNFRHGLFMIYYFRKKLLSAIKKFPLTVKNFRPVSEAIVTSGGVSVKEINPSTMESKLESGIFFAGEVIDVDAYTGGYNLQIAFSTGYLAGKSV